jgi:putative phosphoribosyl transferase
MPVHVHAGAQQTVKMVLRNSILSGDLIVPENAVGIVLFVSGCGNSRQNPRNLSVAHTFNAAGLGTLLFDLLTFEESELDAEGGDFRFNIEFLAQRLSEATVWTRNQEELENLPIGYLGAGIGSAAALLAAEMDDENIKAIVSRGGRLDLAPKALPFIQVPTLLIVGERDLKTLSLNSRAYDVMHCEKEMAIIPRAGHLLEEGSALKESAKLSAEWFKKFMEK